MRPNAYCDWLAAKNQRIPNRPFRLDVTQLRAVSEQSYELRRQEFSAAPLDRTGEELAREVDLYLEFFTIARGDPA